MSFMMVSGGQDANGNLIQIWFQMQLMLELVLIILVMEINTCITGNYNSTHINNSSNNGKYPFVISVACNNGTFTTGTCISETWQRASNLGSQQVLLLLLVLPF